MCFYTLEKESTIRGSLVFRENRTPLLGVVVYQHRRDVLELDERHRADPGREEPIDRVVDAGRADLATVSSTITFSI
jgi:hypothetical protein